MELILIDRKGKRTRRICRECRQVHSKAQCPKGDPNRHAREFFAAAVAFQAAIPNRRVG